MNLNVCNLHSSETTRLSTAASMVAGHLLTRGLKARLAGEVAVDEIPARAEPSRATKPRSREMHAAPA